MLHDADGVRLVAAGGHPQAAVPAAAEADDAHVASGSSEPYGLHRRSS